jgi:PAS domain-containing protein
MAWDWKEDSFKGAIGIVVAWAGAYTAKRFRPSIKYVKAWFKMKDSVTKLEYNHAILNNSFKALLQIDRHPIFIVNNKNEVVFVNAAWMEMTGMRDSKDALGFGWLQAIPEKDRDRILEQGERIQEHPSNFAGHVEFQNVQTGTPTNTWCRSVPVFDDENKFDSIIGRLYIVE